VPGYLQRLTTLQRDRQPGKAQYHVQRTPVGAQPSFDADLVSGESYPQQGGTHGMSNAIVDNTLLQGLGNNGAMAHPQTAFAYQPQTQGGDREPWGYLQSNLSMTPANGAHDQTPFPYNPPMGQASACPYHHPILQGQLPLAATGQDLTPMQRFLNEGPSEQYALVNHEYTGELSIHRDCRCCEIVLGRATGEGLVKE
jgi:hypothetical protein